MELQKLLQDEIREGLYRITISGPRGDSEVSKVRIRPVEIKGKLLFQCQETVGTKEFHKNMTKDDVITRISDWMNGTFKQMQLESDTCTASVLVSKKGTMTIKKKPHMKGTGKPVNLAHNRKKRYILEEGIPVPFLQDLGVMTKEGKIVRTRYDKFRQINRYLEFIEDVINELPTDRTIRIIDFGCGKSYLTFAMYYYLHELKGLTLEVTGLDLKKDVIVHCNELAKKYHYEGLSFLHGDIADYTGTDSADMVVTLHACDTATDYALYKAMKWHAGVILSVPCCQHEVNKQIACEPLEGALKYGLIKERLSALFTDALRADLLEENGYDTQVLEFIDMEHTPKNILLRAVRRVDAGMADGQSGLTEAEQKSGQCSKETSYQEPDSKRLAETLQIHTTLQKLLEGELV